MRMAYDHFVFFGQATIEDKQVQYVLKKFNGLSFDTLVDSDDNVESNCSIIANIPPKGVSFSDFIAIFAMAYQSFVYFHFFCNTKISEISDTAKTWATFCC